MGTKIAYVGVDYHLNSLSTGVMVEGEREILETMQLPNDDKLILRYFKKLSEKYTVRICYEASGSGYAFQRKVNSWGYHCDVIAPSLIPKKRGNRRKNDFRDARELAQYYAKGLLTVVHPPNEQEESLRSLIRCRMAFKKSEKTVKHQINSLLLGQDVRWGQGSKWTLRHRQWLATVRFSTVYLQEALDEYLAHFAYLEASIARLDERIRQIADSERYACGVRKFRALKGVGTLSAVALIAEIMDFRRFPRPEALMAYLGLIPSERSSGETTRGGHITGTGNTLCRRLIIEIVQHYRKKPRISKEMQDELQQTDPRSAAIAIKCLNRLHKRFWALVMKGKIQSVALTAIGREFVGFLWALMQPEPVTV